MSQPIGLYEEVTGFLAVELSVVIKGLKLPFFIPKTALVQSASSDSVYSPDVLLLNRSVLKSEKLWQKSSTVQLGASIPLVVIVSSNSSVPIPDIVLKFRLYRTIHRLLFSKFHDSSEYYSLFFSCFSDTYDRSIFFMDLLLSWNIKYYGAFDFFIRVSISGI